MQTFILVQRAAYRGLRFDWSRVIGRLKLDGHDFYTPWFDKYDASVLDFAFRDRDIVAATTSAATWSRGGS
jgi:hypothetical protein